MLAVENSAAIPGGSLLVIGPGGSVVLGAPRQPALGGGPAPGAGPLAAAVAVVPAAVDRVLATQSVPASNAVAPAIVGRAILAVAVRPLTGCLGSTFFILHPFALALVLPVSPVRVGDATPRVALLRTAASTEASDEVLLRVAEARAGKRRRAGWQSAGPATSLFGLDLPTLDILAAAAPTRMTGS